MKQYNIVILNGDGSSETEYVFGNKEPLTKGKNIYISSFIHSDDTIRTVKKKILKYCLPHTQNRCVEEVYLFSEIISGKNVSLGVKLPKGVPVNPFNFVEYKRDSISIRHDESLLLEHITQDTRSINVCFVDDFTSKKNTGKLLELYFPNIDTIDVLDELRRKADHLTNSFTYETQYIDLFKNAGNDKTNSVEFVAEGVSHFDIIYTPKTQVNMSLDDVFNMIHATQNIPLVQHNAYGRNKQYRLYAPDIATNGEHIPYLNKAVINKFRKQFTISNRTTFFMNSDSDNEVICEFINSNGNIAFRLFVDKLSKELGFEELTNYIEKYLNNIIQKINKRIEISGRHIELFESLTSENVAITDISYSTMFTTEKNIKFDKKSNCISGVFHIYDKETLMFKRVSNYNGNQNIGDNNGFVTKVNIEKNRLNKNKNYFVVMHDINNIGYLDTVPKFLQAIVNVNIESSKELCKLEKKLESSSKFDSKKMTNK